MSAKRIIVTMATGTQGSGLIRALAKRNQSTPNTFEILAVTRSAQSGKAKKLEALPGVRLLESEYIPEQIFEKASKDGPIYGVFSVQSAMLLPSHVPKGVEGETVLGKEVADVAAKYDVKHFIYTSVDQGGLPKTEVPHFEAKRFVEEYLAEKHAQLPKTILRPVAFMDNFSTGETMFGKVMNTALVTLTKVPIQLISATDIGEFAALAFENPSEYIGKTISLAGDELTPEQIQQTYQSVKGSKLPTTFSIFPKLITFLNKDMGSMFKFFNDHGYKADIAQLRQTHPELKTFEQYLKTEM
ncbi:NAD(P)-binding protein [Meira miltonrushii]|uniref:NAD(P)-binding protein n=1 Tax=Meira miltonrushii TaxID=1280837 RepID=A0A316V999_9BASI|nr:NAD(P)-binding protein [Meira miltonrushii]PWN32763.1 NAD(P)-binding protein [Meira miltonrushii]